MYESLLDQIASNGENTKKWVTASQTYFRTFIHSDLILKHFSDEITIVMHGSTTRNIDDAHSDLDFWLVLDDITYPYEKWLYVQANFHETPKSLIRHVDNIITEIKRNPAALHGPENENKISHELRAIRAKIVEKVKRDGIDELWLEKWWRYIDRSREIVSEVRWPTAW